MKNPCPKTLRLFALAGLAAALTLTACTQEQQNKLGRGVQNWTGTDGVLDVYTGDKLAMRFIEIDKMSTGIGHRQRRRSPLLPVWLRGRRLELQLGEGPRRKESVLRGQRLLDQLRVLRELQRLSNWHCIDSC